MCATYVWQEASSCPTRSLPSRHVYWGTQEPLSTRVRLAFQTSAMAGVPTTALMRAMGHRSPIMTARYSEFADAERRWAFARADITKGLRLRNAR